MAVKKRRKPVGLSLIERAVLAAKEREMQATAEFVRQLVRDEIETHVRETYTAAQIHAMTGEDSDVLVNKAGRMFFVVLGACIADGFDSELADVRILRGACNAMFEQAGIASIANARRASIVSGLEACGRLLEQLDYDSVIDEAVSLEIKLTTGHVDWHDFEARIAEVAPA